MLGLYLFLVGAYLYYCQSKYYPAGLYKVTSAHASWLALVLFAVGTGLYIEREGWISGLLLGVCALSLALMLLQLVAVLGKFYFYGLVAMAHGLVLLDLLS